MAKIKQLTESKTGGAETYKVGKTTKTRCETVKEIKEGKHPNYHIVKIKGAEYARSNPDGKTFNNIDT